MEVSEDSSDHADQDIQTIKSEPSNNICEIALNATLDPELEEVCNAQHTLLKYF